MGKHKKRSPQKDEPSPPKKSQGGGAASPGARGSPGGAAADDDDFELQLPEQGPPPPAPKAAAQPAVAQPQQRTPLPPLPPLSPGAQERFLESVRPLQVPNPPMAPPSPPDPNAAPMDWQYDHEPLPADGMQEPGVWLAPPLQHGGDAPQVVTRVCAVKSAFTNPDHAGLLQQLAQFWPIIKVYVFGILARLASDFVFEYEKAATAEERKAVLNRFCTTAEAMESGTIFDETNVTTAVSEVIDRVGKTESNTPAEPAARRGTRATASDAPPPRRHPVVEAAAAYFADPELRAAVAALRKPELWSSGVCMANRKTIVTAFANFYKYANLQLQRYCLREEHGLYGKEAKKVSECVGPANSERLEICVKARVKAAKALGHRARERADAAHRNLAEAEADLAALPAGADAAAVAAASKEVEDAKVEAAKLDAAFEEAQKKVDEQVKNIKESDQEALEEEMLARLPQRKPRRKPASEEEEEEEEAGAPAPRTLRQIAEDEMERVPETMKQYELLLYRQRLLRRLAAAVAPERHSYLLSPKAKLGLQFVHLQHETVHKLVTGTFKPPKPKGKKGKKAERRRTGDNSFQSLLNRLIKPSARKKLLRGRAQTGDFGPSFCTDGTAVHFTVLNAAALKGKERKAEAAREGQAQAARGAAVDEPDELDDVDELLDFSDIDTRIKEHKHKSIPVLPKGHTITALDIGRRNVYGRASDGYDTAPSPAKGQAFAGRKGRGSANDPDAKLAVLSLREFKHQAGHYARRRTLQRDLARERRDNPAFAAAEAAILDADTSATDRDELLAALQARAKAAPELCRFYSTPRRAKARFNAFNAERKVMERHIKLLVPTSLHYVVIGDGMFPSSMRGGESGIGAKFQRLLVEWFPDNVFYMDENRTSKLESQTKRVMYNPPGGVYTDRKGVQRIRRVHGHMQCAFPGYSVRWNRDINAAINILLNFRYLYKHGELPWEFRRSTDASSLQRSPAADRKYSRVEGEKGYRRR